MLLILIAMPVFHSKKILIRKRACNFELRYETLGETDVGEKNMGLFDQIISAVANPNQQGSLGQVAGVFSAVQQLSNSTGADTSAMQSVMGIVGNYVRSSLQEKQANDGEDQVQALVHQFSGTTPNQQAVSSVFSPAIEQEVASVVQERTGLDAGMVQQMLPTLVPLVLQMLHMGASTQNPQSGGNPVLNAFLDKNGDGNVDLTEMMQMAAQFMGHGR
jgi:hypothetical protein